MTKIVYSALTTLILSLLIALLVYANKYHKTQAKLAKTELALQLQNKAIEEQRLEFENYKKATPKLQKQIEFRYRNITTKDSTCEAKLESIQKC